MSNRITIVLTLVVSLFAAALSAQNEVVVSYADDFQSYGTQKNPPGWVDTSVGSSKPAAGGLYKTWPDPLQGNQGTNIVYGTKQSSGKPDGTNPRTGTSSTSPPRTSAAKARSDYPGPSSGPTRTRRTAFPPSSGHPGTDNTN